MKLILKIGFLALIITSIGCKTTTNEQIKEIEIAEFGNILDSFQVVGSILIYDYDNKTYYSNDFEWAKEGNLPASTFKIPNSIIAVELGVIESDTTIIKWDGEERKMDIWEKDLTYKEAFQVSCVPCYQEIARQIGYNRMKDYLEKFDYKQMVFDSSTIDNFWLEGDSKISQFEQIEFLVKFYNSKLPISERTEEIVKKIMVVEETENYILSAKTGWGTRKGNDNGWFVGFIETDNKVYFFATNVIPNEESNIDNFLLSRKKATLDALRDMKIII
ncbi:MAG: class D beta-lactamase [Bacteroidales bacterium]|nr:class D beta-lactamase [Bacteroidales bacterium]